ncbi:hydroxyisourate hydrolase [Variovorax sp. J22R24]|uniref:hydroxyisourate hydrolase n=1 Tax=Variovorax gracilis TaxID=3053502 RepID=UPI002574989D|nr:hydroxyisourate hydrolase [Variovorax sp. J22R24]MDM0108119.1 hydroxyisourate hydrolase [Variovorax sp. J22R24]
MQAVSIHVVDVANGVVAVGMRVEILRQASGEQGRPERWEPLVAGKVGRNGVVDGFEGQAQLFNVGVYEMRLHVGDYYRERGQTLPEPAFMDVQCFRFGLADLSRHYHLPVKLTPWGLSCFRGAA